MKKTTASGMVCNCGHHKWAKGLGLIVAGLVFLYTAGNWGYTIIALGVMKLGTGMCKCCNC